MTTERANKRYGKVTKRIWFRSENQYNQLVSAIEGNNNEEIIRIMKEIWIEGDL